MAKSSAAKAPAAPAEAAPASTPEYKAGDDVRIRKSITVPHDRFGTVRIHTVMTGVVREIKDGKSTVRFKYADEYIDIIRPVDAFEPKAKVYRA